MKKIIEANFHPVLAWHPSVPRKEGEKLEPDLWAETDGWNKAILLWVVSPDKKTHEPIDYLDREAKGVTSAKKLEEKFKEILGKHGVKFVEPPAGK